jgi:hypothetical protein
MVVATCLLGCSKTTAKPEPDGGAHASSSAGASTVAPTDAAAVTVRAAASRASGEALITWHAATGTGTKVNVSLVVGHETFALGALEATSDGSESGTPAACSIRPDG